MLARSSSAGRGKDSMTLASFRLTLSVLAAVVLLWSPGAIANHGGCHANGAPCTGAIDNTTGRGEDKPQDDPCTDESGETIASCEQPETCAQGSDPVSVVSGRLFLAETDMVINGVYPIELVRRYSSHSDYDSQLGYGWAFTYDMQLFDYTAAADKEVVVRSGCGVRVRYAYDDLAQTYAAPEGSRTTLLKNGSNHTLIYPGGRRVHFTALGLVEAFEDPQGNRLEFTYEDVPANPGVPAKFNLIGTTPFAADPTAQQVVAQQYRIKTIQERLVGGATFYTGRKVTFVYDGVTGRLSTATSHDGRVVTYTQETDGPTVTGNLASVLGLEGITSTYVYEDASPPTRPGAVSQTPYQHNLVEMTHGQGTATWYNEYDAEDRVVRQSRGDPALAGSRRIDFTFSEGQTTVQRRVTDAAGLNPYFVDTVYDYDATGKISDISDALMQRQEFTRYEAGETGVTPAEVGLLKRIEVINAAGEIRRRTDFTYDDAGFLETKTVYLDFLNDEIDPAGRTVTTTEDWDPQGWLTTREIASSDAPTTVFRTVFDFYRDGIAPGPSQDPSGRITNVYSIARWNDVEAIDETTLFDYATENGLVSRVELPDGHQIDRTYYDWDAGSARAGMAQETFHIEPGTGDPGDPDPHLRVLWDYDTRSNVNSVVDARGIAGTPADFETTLTWDQLGRLREVINPGAGNGSSSFTYTEPTLGLADPSVALPGNFLSLIERTDGATTQSTRFRHDGNGNLQLVERDNGGTWQTFETRTWDSDDQLLSQTRPRGTHDPNNPEETAFAYDPLGRIESTTATLEPGNPDITTVTEFAYDVTGNRTTITEAKGSGIDTDTTLAYDGLDRLLSVSQDPTGLALVTEFTYDAVGNITEVEDPRDNATAYSYDTLSRLLSVQQPMGQTVTYDWDLRGRLDSTTNGRNQVLDYVYEDWGPLKEVLHVGTSRSVKFAYDRVGNIASVWDQELQTNVAAFPRPPLEDLPAGRLFDTTYDALNRPDVTAIHYVGLPSSVNTIELDAGYDGFGNRISLDVTDGGVDYDHGWQFNNLNQLAQATFPGSGTTLPGAPVSLSFEYFDNDDLRQITHGNSATTDYTYFSNGFVDTITVENASSTQLHLLDYAIDQRLNVDSIAEQVGATSLSPDWDYGYDDASRLTSATYPTNTGVSSLPGSDTLPYDDAGNRDDNSSSPTPWSYNANNEIEQSPELLYESDQDGNLCKWVPASGAIANGCAAGDADETRFEFDYTNRLRTIHRPDSSTVTYRYDPFGRRLSKTVSGLTTWFVWNGDQLVAEYEGSGDRSVRYAYAGGFSPVQVAYPNGTTGEDVYEVHVNHLDTPRMITNAAEAAVWRSYDEAYGRSHVDTSLGAGFNIRFPGQYYDAETERWDPTLNMGAGGLVERSGLHYNHWRYYSPSSGRYTRHDPLGSVRLLEPAFVQANPARRSSSSRHARIERFSDPELHRLSWPSALQDTSEQPIVETNSFTYAVTNPIGRIDPTGLTTIVCKAGAKGDPSLQRCLRACKSVASAQRFCKTIPYAPVRAACYGAAAAGTVPCRGFCYWYFGGD